MAGPFFTVLEAPNINGYDPRRRREPASAQPASVPRPFVDAMSVRLAVFVDEQGVPPDAELDEDDPRSCHLPRQAPLGTVRVVPYPQPPHPQPGAAYTIINGENVLQGHWVAPTDGTATTTSGQGAGDKAGLVYVPAAAGAPSVEVAAAAADRPTALHDGREPYVKIGRLAVVQSARGQRLGQLLVEKALDWIRTHPDAFDRPPFAAAAAAASPSGTPAAQFNGLVCVHAQAHLDKFYERLGFVVDKDMGTWWEEGIPHVGMFQRVDLLRS
ncbi:acetyltransferase [Niveomyces insectorum RCEF 264]|uniref:Acetyltransferase n=1 Tax=Niveomyces insectorum RCEF 264 TaxID=1081102 RepID=A0A167QAI9_9HYPO|nr:acetyltransferase [Niveomyces insectorum RCEF 264]